MPHQCQDASHARSYLNSQTFPPTLSLMITITISIKHISVSHNSPPQALFPSPSTTSPALLVPLLSLLEAADKPLLASLLQCLLFVSINEFFHPPDEQASKTSVAEQARKQQAAQPCLPPDRQADEQQQQAGDDEADEQQQAVQSLLHLLSPSP